MNKPNPLCDICHKPTGGIYALQDYGRVIGRLIVCSACLAKKR